MKDKILWSKRWSFISFPSRDTVIPRLVHRTLSRLKTGQWTRWAGFFLRLLHKIEINQLQSCIKHFRTWLAEMLTVGTAGWVLFAGSITYIEKVTNIKNCLQDKIKTFILKIRETFVFLLCGRKGCHNPNHCPASCSSGF